MSNLSPIILFVYNRLWHTQQTIEALQKNELASDSELFIYADGAKDKKVSDQVLQVRNYIKKIDGFKKVIIIERDKNWGLANSIIDGVTQAVDKHGRVIVLEDDLITSPYFLNYMNDALNFYQDKKNIMHISGWNYPISTCELNDIFLWRGMNCWGWATWQDRWLFFEKDSTKLIADFTKADIHKFNIDGYQKFWTQVLRNHSKKIDTWAVFWYASIFKRSGLCVNPSSTFVTNIGNDDSGENCSNFDVFRSKLNHKRIIKFDDILALNEDKIAVNRIKIFNSSIRYHPKRYTAKLKYFFLKMTEKLFS